MSTTKYPAGGPLVDPARTAAIHAIRLSVEERLDAVLEHVDDYLSGEQTRLALIDARNTLSMIDREIIALDQLGPPMSIRDYYADSLKGPGAATS